MFIVDLSNLSIETYFRILKQSILYFRPVFEFPLLGQTPQLRTLIKSLNFNYIVNEG